MPAPTTSATFSAPCDSQGVLHVDRLVKQAIAAFARDHLRNCQVDITFSKHRASKSRDQLAWYWGAILPALADRTGYSPEEMHAWCAYKFLNPPERKTLEIVDVNGEIVEYADVQVVPDRVSLLTTGQMADYLTDICEFAGASLGLHIPPADKHWKQQKARGTVAA
jgi:hypothetical protein